MDMIMRKHTSNVLGRPTLTAGLLILHRHAKGSTAGTVHEKVLQGTKVSDHD